MKNSRPSSHKPKQKEKVFSGRRKCLFLSCCIVLCLLIGGGILAACCFDRTQEEKENASSKEERLLTKEDPVEADRCSDPDRLSQTKSEEKAEPPKKENSASKKIPENERGMQNASKEETSKEETSKEDVSKEDASESSAAIEPENLAEASKDTFKEETSLSPHVHQYRQTTVVPDCTTKGYTQYTCACGDSYIEKTTPPLGHAFSEWETILWPTYDEEGLKQRVCTRCFQSEQQSIATLVPYLLTEADKQQIYDRVRIMGESYGFTCYGVGSSQSYLAPSGTFESWRGREYTIEALVSGTEGDFYMMRQEGGRSGFMMLIVGDGYGGGTSNGCDYEIYIYQI